MINGIEVFEAIKSMSGRTLNPRHRILFVDIASKLDMPQDRLLLILTELEDAGYIKLHRTKVVSVTLTSHGLSTSIS